MSKDKPAAAFRTETLCLRSHPMEEEVTEQADKPVTEAGEGELRDSATPQRRDVINGPESMVYGDQHGDKMPFHHVTAGLLYKGNYLSHALSDETDSDQLASISVEELNEIREAFRVLDRDGNGFISKQELGMAMRSLGYMPSEVELAIIMQRLDMDGDGQVDFDEFMTILGPKLLSSETREGFLGSTIDSIFWQLDTNSAEGKLHRENFLDIPKVYTQRTMPVGRNNILTQQDQERWKYLSGIKIPSLEAEVELLIGTNAPKLMEPWDIINSQGEGPYAVRTLLGKSVRKQLKEILGAEASRKKTDKHIDLLLQKPEMDCLRGKNGMSENSAQEKEALKKPTHAQEQRAERFEAAVNKCYSQLKMKDIQLAEACY
ncbi:hypothetical protein DPEC_G00246470 [Dallia pectoralis]|uniref:Uncharacterized protein n=1 Tax=Dallia pectoralis TaxID=75939 RepID=A0ACC2FW91_DALPE|nr:hypothetical protein DPEC_G00246470 [Dallia pectoralis]